MPGHLRAPALRNDAELELLRSRMSLQDSLAPEVRRLIYEHGQMRVFQLLDDGVTDPEDLADLLC